jgi:hypothetical protein
MTNGESMSLPAPAFAGGTKAITMTPVVGTPRREYPEMFIPGEEELEDGDHALSTAPLLAWSPLRLYSDG